MGKRSLYNCNICGKQVPEECLEHLRIFHPEEYSFKKTEFIENAVIIGLDSVAAKNTIRKMSGEDLEKAIKEENLQKRIPRSYDNLKDVWARDNAKKWYMQKLLLDERAKSIIRIIAKKMSETTDIGNAEKIAVNLVNRYTKKPIRSCYDERIIALSAILVACHFCQKEVNTINVKDLILQRDVDPEEFKRIYNWMEKQILPDKAYVDLLLKREEVIKIPISSQAKKTVKKFTGHFRQLKLDEIIKRSRIDQ